MSMLDWFLGIPGVDPGDDIPPTIVISSAATSPVGSTIQITAVASEPVYNLLAGGIAGTGCVISNLQTADNITWTFDATPDFSGDMSVQIPAGVCTDKADNLNAASNSLTLQIAKVYGVSWDKGSSPVLTRTDDAVGMTANAGVDATPVVNDFDTAQIFGDITEVADAAGNTLVRIPKFYIKKAEN